LLRSVLADCKLEVSPSAGTERREDMTEQLYKLFEQVSKGLLTKEEFVERLILDLGMKFPPTED
jgi:hypothetical protein